MLPFSTIPRNSITAAQAVTARTGNGVFQTSAGAGVTTAWIDNGQVSDPAALTGSTYTLQFSVTAGATTYAVLRDGNPTAVTAAPYTSGQDITVDGMTFRVSGTPAAGDSFTVAPSSSTLSIFDTLDRAVAQLATGGRSTAQIAQGNTDALRDIDQSMAQLQGARAVAGEIRAHRGRDLAAGRPEAGRAGAARECGGFGHDRGDLEVPEQANRLRCRAEVVLDGAAPVAVRLPQRLIPMLDVAILGQVAFGYSPYIDRNRSVSATRLTVFPLRPDMAPDAAQLLEAIAGVWPADGAKVSLNVASESLLQELMQAQPAGNVMVEIPAFMACDAANTAAIVALHGHGNTLLLKGRPLAELPREVLPCFKYSIIDLADDRRLDGTQPPPGVTRSIPHLQAGVRTIAQMEQAFARGAEAVLGWPIDDAIHCRDAHHALALKHISEVRRMVVHLVPHSRRKRAPQHADFRILVLHFARPLAGPACAQRHRQRRDLGRSARARSQQDCANNERAPHTSPKQNGGRVSTAVCATFDVIKPFRACDRSSTARAIPADR